MATRKVISMTTFEKQIRLASWKSKHQGSALRHNFQRYALLSVRPHPLRAPGQIFDSFYLWQSPLFRRSRKIYLDGGGVLESRLVTSARSLSSAILLENRIQYSPTEDELLWCATDDEERKSPERCEENLLRTITYSTSLFHEQSHRILWQTLPAPADLALGALSRYLNFVESLVVGIDMALGDELGPKLSSLGYLSGTLYDPGSHARFKTSRERRNYLHVAIRTTYLALEFFEKPRIRKFLRAEMPQWLPSVRPEVADHAIARALRLDSAFVRVTNPLWQEKHLPAVARRFRGLRGSLVLDRDPANWTGPYLAIEKTFDRLGI